MSADEQRWWFKRLGRGDNARARLFCFHCAGGSAAMFRGWPRQLPESVEVIGVQLPGRLDRFSEAPYYSMGRLVTRIADVIEPLLDRPFSCYGVSMGARVAWTLTHLMRDRGMPSPSRLYVASNVAPSVATSGQEWEQPDSRLVEYLRELGGTPAEVLADAGLCRQLVSVLRADLTVLATQDFSPVAPLDIPVHAFAGREDEESPAHQMTAWRAETSGGFRMDVVPGGHFFSPAGVAEVLALISAHMGADGLTGAVV